MNRTSRAWLRTLPLLVLAISAACVESTGGQRDRVGFISLNVFNVTNVGPVLRPVGAFYHANGINPNFFTRDTCFFAAYSTQPPGIASLPTLEAGSELETRVSGRTDSLFLDTSLGLNLYQVLTVPFIPYTPGDTFRLIVPGQVDGFPTVDLRVKTPEPFTLTPLVPGDFNDPMQLSWTPAPSAGSRMQLSIRFAGGTTSSGPDTQIFCNVADDGSHAVSALLADTYRGSQPEFRSYAASRIRVTTVSLDSRTSVNLLGFYDQPLQTYVAP